MKEEYAIDCPAIPITHAFVEFQNMKIRDRYLRSANVWKNRIGWKKDQNISSSGSRRQDSTEKGWDSSNLRSTKKKGLHCITSK